MNTERTERDEQQKKSNKTCNEHVKTGLERNVTIQFLLERLIGMGCNPPENFIKCLDCGDRAAGGGFSVIEEQVYDKKPCDNINSIKNLKSEQDGKVIRRLLPEIFLCQQHIRSETHAHESLCHELIHAIDLCR